jgi:hypothetical protein
MSDCDVEGGVQNGAPPVVLFVFWSKEAFLVYEGDPIIFGDALDESGR